MAGAFKDATYYIGVCGYKVALAFHEMCKACNGSGAIGRRTRRTYTERTCKKCKGHPIIQEIPETPWVPGEQVKLSEVEAK
jgi:DnaJ-class molecular chaperone